MILTASVLYLRLVNDEKITCVTFEISPYLQEIFKLKKSAHEYKTHGNLWIHYETEKHWN